MRSTVLGFLAYTSSGNGNFFTSEPNFIADSVASKSFFANLTWHNNLEINKKSMYYK